MNAADPLVGLLDEPVLRTVARIAGSEPCHLIGGVVRDRLEGRASRDFDLTIERGAEELAERLASELALRLVRLGGDRFSALRLVGEGFQIDLWNREGGSLEADIERRDFSVNSIAVGLTDGEVVDPLGGREDVRARRLRANRETSFEEDPLRVVRLVRFAAHGYRVEPRTAEWARKAAPALASVAPERIREELRLALEAPRGSAAAHWLTATGLYPGLWSGGRIRPGSPTPESSPVGLLSRELERRLERDGARGKDAALARHALLAAAIATPQQNTEARLRGLETRGFLSRREREEILPLATRRALPRSEVQRRRFLHAVGGRWRLATAVQATLAGAEERTAWDRLGPALDRLLASAPEIVDPSALLDGREIQHLTGVEPGPRLGRLVRGLRKAQVDGTVRSRDEAIGFVREAAREAGVELPPPRRDGSAVS